MRGLFFKVFIVLWIAQSLIFVISTALIVRHHFDGGPQVFADAFDSGINNEAREALTTFETGGCDAMRAFGATHDHAISLQDASGDDPCQPGVQAPVVDRTSKSISGRQVGLQYVWSVPIASAVSGKQYFFL